MELFAKTYTQLYDINCIGLRFFTVYGPRGRPDMAPYKFLKAISEGKKFKKFGDGTTSRDYTYVDDIVDGIIKASNCGKKNEIYNLGNSSPISLNKFIEVCEKGIVGEIYNIGCDENMEYSVLDIAKILIKKIKNTDEYDKWIEYIEDRPFNDKRYYISNEKLKQLEWNITINLEKGLNKLIL